MRTLFIRRGYGRDEVAAAFFAMGICALCARPGLAAVSASFLDGTLAITVSTGASDNVTVTTNGTYVTVNGQSGLTGSPVLPGAVTQITINCFGGSSNPANTIDLRGVSTANGFVSPGAGIDFTSIVTGTGPDTIYGSEFQDFVDAGDGNDTVYMSPGDDFLYGGAGNDTFYMTPPASGATVTVDGGGNTDLLDYFAQAHMVTDTPSVPGQGTIAGSGVGTVNYYGIESRNIHGLPFPEVTLSRFIDDNPDVMFTIPDSATLAPGIGRVTVTNTGFADLGIYSITLENNDTGFFTFAGLPPAVPTTVTVAGGAKPSLVVNMVFDGFVFDETTCLLKLVHNPAGDSRTMETGIVLRAAGNIVDQVWDGGDPNLPTFWDSPFNWEPDAPPANPFTHLKVDGSLTTWTATKSDGNIKIGLPNPYKLTVASGAMGDGKLWINGTNWDLTVGVFGEVLQSSGIVTIARDYLVANSADAVASMTMTGGRVAARNLGVGYAGRGYANISGGTLNLTGNINIAFLAAGNGVANISGGVIRANLIRDGGQGTGALNVSGNANITATGNLIFGDSATGRGSFRMSGGTLAAVGITTGAGTLASWNWTDGSIAASYVLLPGALANGGGALLAGGANVGTTTFLATTGYAQTAGSLRIDLDNLGRADRLVMSSGTATLAGGAIDIGLLNGGPSSGGSWDVIVAQDGAIDVGAVAVNLPGPGWSVTSDSTKVTVSYIVPPTLAVEIAGTTVTLPRIVTSRGETASTATFTIRNAGELDLAITTATIFGTSYTLVQPAASDLPTTLTPNTTASVTVSYEGTTTGTYYGAVTFDSNDPRSPTYVGLRVSVYDFFPPASGVEAWKRY